MILAIEAAVGGGSLSLFSGGRVVAGWVGESDLSRAEDLLPAINAMISEGGFSTDDVSMIAVATGPGSFTGIRIGISTALGLSAGLGIPLASVSMLRAMANAARSGNGPIIAALPMGRGSVCIQRFEYGSTTSTPETIEELEFKGRIAQSSETIVVHDALAGNGPRTGNLVNLGTNLAQVLAAFAEANPRHVEGPLFVAKSF